MAELIIEFDLKILYSMISEAHTFAELTIATDTVYLFWSLGRATPNSVIYIMVVSVSLITFWFWSETTNSAYDILTTESKLFSG